MWARPQTSAGRRAPPTAHSCDPAARARQTPPGSAGPFRRACLNLRRGTRQCAAQSRRACP
eukprot:5135044-Prymnesium_polylepis.2